MQININHDTYLLISVVRLHLQTPSLFLCSVSNSFYYPLMSASMYCVYYVFLLQRPFVLQWLRFNKCDRHDHHDPGKSP